ncbi:hypothetical protein AB0K60_30950 [Thermopolyspora sp. NPDC052614]|uniref:hypothetical protein n=1 Tax=Thermopolyspora sp. NPDC052614 TaxID=3155682 RepID=UPI003437587F
MPDGRGSAPPTALVGAGGDVREVVAAPESSAADGSAEAEGLVGDPWAGPPGRPDGESLVTSVGRPVGEPAEGPMDVAASAAPAGTRFRGPTDEEPDQASQAISPATRAAATAAAAVRQLEAAWRGRSGSSYSGSGSQNRLPSTRPDRSGPPGPRRGAPNGPEESG